MNKPTVNTAWATAESAKKVEPLESQRESGWIYQDTPSSGVVNNWMNAVHQWLRYFESFGDPRPDIEDLQKRVKWLESEIKKHRRRPEEVHEPVPEFLDFTPPIFPLPIEIPQDFLPPIIDPFPEQPITTPKGDPIYVHDDTQRPIDRTRPSFPMATENSLPESDGPIGQLCPTENE